MVQNKDRGYFKRMCSEIQLKDVRDHWGHQGPSKSWKPRASRCALAAVTGTHTCLSRGSFLLVWRCGLPLHRPPPLSDAAAGMGMSAVAVMQSELYLKRK